MTLKEMIEEARIMAETPARDATDAMGPDDTIQGSDESSRKYSATQGISLLYAITY